jgi:hypothetical protein
MGNFSEQVTYQATDVLAVPPISDPRRRSVMLTGRGMMSASRNERRRLEPFR